MPRVMGNMVEAVVLASSVDAGEARTFHPGTVDHYLAVAVTVVATGLLCWLGVRWRGTKKGELLRSWWIGLVAVVQALSLWFYVGWRPFDWAYSMPLEICDLLGFVSVLALATQWRVARVTLYYWTFALTTHAFVTPILRQGPESLRYYVFWGTHLVIVASAMYDVVVNRFRPRGWDFGLVTLVMLLYGAVVIPLNVVMGYNYGFTGNDKPDTATLVDVLGPWPLRLVWMFVLIEAVFALLTVIWWRPTREGSAGRVERGGNSGGEPGR